MTKMNNTNKYNYIQFKKGQIDLLERLFKDLDDYEENLDFKYDVIGVSETEQDTRWNGELLWEDEEKTIPRMKRIWGNVPVDPDEQDAEWWAKKAAVKEIRALLEKSL